MESKNLLTEFTEKEYNEFFCWLFDKDNIKLEKEIDISKCLEYEEPYIYYTPEIRDFFESKAMKRLDRIGQLANISLDNPNSSHTRLEHCKGAYQKILDFYMLQYKKSEWREKNCDETSRLKVLANMMDMASHDIGHNFLSHALEKLIGSKKGAHEVLGNRILHENSEVVQNLYNIHPRLSENLDIVKQEDYNLHTLKEGNIDFDRADFLTRDSIFLGVENGFYDDKGDKKSITQLLDKVYNGCDIYSIKLNGKDIEVPVFSYDVVPEIEEVLQRRAENYKEIYTSKRNKPRDIFLEEICKAIMLEDDTNSDLKIFLENISEAEIEDIDLDEFIKWDDIRFYNCIFDIIDNTKNENLKKFLMVGLPEHEALVSIVYDKLFPNITPMIDENGNEIDIENEFESIEDRKFYLKIKDLVKDTSNYAQYTKNSCVTTELMNTSFKTKEELEGFLKQLEESGISKDTIKEFETWNRKIKKYNKSEPIFIKGRDGKIYTFDEYPERKMDISNIEDYGIVGIESKLLLKGVDISEIQNCKRIFEQMSSKEDKSSKLNHESTRFNSELKDIKSRKLEEDGR